VFSTRPSGISSACRQTTPRILAASAASRARTHFSLSQIENACPLPALRHLQQCAAAGLLHVVAVRRNR
jgi:hypothetical protein